ncbi:copper amine oxidase N-terminal domain-containing protein [Paenibacillus sp. LjRoot56]|uniref:copper amine oxidase N-terminal domain-containing protein n=1 Tax=Paenibacillus sp. LjRoot56 TaxID=3342333 RepID=UPI003F4FD432
MVSPQAQILLDEANLRLEVPPVNDQGTVMVPMRPIFEALQANVSWDQSKKTVTAVKKEVNIQLTVGSLSAMVNDREVHLAKAP